MNAPLPAETASIRERRDGLARRLADAEGAVIEVEGQIKALQHICRHPNAKQWTSGDYGGGSTDYFECPDCGLETAR